MKKLAAWTLIAFAPFAHAQPSPAASFPNKPIRIVVGFTPGGSPDVLARAVAQKLQAVWNQPVVVDNQPGAGGGIAARTVAQAPADGYTWMVAPNNVMVFAPLLGTVPYDPVKDFAPVGLGISVQNLLVVAPSVPVASVADLIKLAKARPGELTYASAGPGSPQNFSTEYFKSVTGTQIQHVPYKGAQELMPDLLAGRVDVYLGQSNALLPHIGAGRLKLLGGSGEKRYASLPDVPAISETIPGFTVDIWSGFVMPAGTPKAIVDKVNTEIVKILAMADVQAALAKQGIEARSSSPDEMAATIRSDIERWGKIVKEARMRTE